MKIDEPDDEALAAACGEGAGVGEAPGDAAGADTPPPPPQPPIEEADLAACVALLTAPIGGEQPNGLHAKALKPNATAAEREAYDASHVENEATGQTVHKRAALAFVQKQSKDAKPGAGHQQCYITGERQQIVAEDQDGSGFACGKYYEVHVGDSGVPLNGESELMLEGELRVGYARVLELRKLNGKRRVLRLSVRERDASRCSAVVLPLVEQEDGRWAADCRVACPVLVPLVSLGREVAASSDGPAGMVSLACLDKAAGGPQLRAICLSEDLFAASAMLASVSVDLMQMKVAELKEELEAREQPTSSNKPWLRRRLYAAIVRAYLDSQQDDPDGLS